VEVNGPKREKVLDWGKLVNRVLWKYMELKGKKYWTGESL